MTEQEAKTKPCIGPDPSNIGSIVILPGDGGVKFLCIGSACMAWREQLRSETIKGDTRAEDHIAYHIKGFCGLAGKP